MSKKIKKWNENKSLKVWKKIPKSTWKLEFNENKQTEYTKKLIKEIKDTQISMEKREINRESLWSRWVCLENKRSNKRSWKDPIENKQSDEKKNR